MCWKCFKGFALLKMEMWGRGIGCFRAAEVSSQIKQPHRISLHVLQSLLSTHPVTNTPSRSSPFATFKETISMCHDHLKSILVLQSLWQLYILFLSRVYPYTIVWNNFFVLKYSGPYWLSSLTPTPGDRWPFCHLFIFLAVKPYSPLAFSISVFLLFDVHLQSLPAFSMARWLFCL